MIAYQNKILLVLYAAIFITSFVISAHAKDKPAPIKVMIIDGQNNHKWRQTTPVIQKILEDTGRFTVQVATAPAKGEDNRDFKPNFKDYDVVVSNYNGEAWPQPTQKALVQYMQGGGGLVIIHAADNAFPKWRKYNEMIGLAGWGGRNETAGPYVYFKDGRLVRDDSPGPGGHHGRRHAFVVTRRDTDHPIMRDLPEHWLHTRDELYERLRGPAKNMTVLASAFADPETGGSGRDEPILMTITFGKGRVFHTALGHDLEAMGCIGFRTTTARGAEWAAVGEVTLPIPDDFPTANQTSVAQEPHG